MWALSLFSFYALSASGQAAVISHAAPGVSSHTAGSASHETSAAALQALAAKGVKPHYLSLYALHPAQRLWADEHAVVQLQQQLAEVALSGVQRH
ncbi:hypothetical protein ACWWJF_20320 [Symbiopectobacterium sp. Eva_TO]